MIKSIFDSCFLYKFNFFAVVNMQTNDILMLVNNVFAIVKNQTIKKTKIMIKNRNKFIMNQSIKFNEIKIQLKSNETITITKKLHVKKIILIIKKNAFSINFKNITRSKLSTKKQYVTQRVRDAYMISICQFKTSFDFFHVAQIININDNDIIALNKRLQ